VKLEPIARRTFPQPDRAEVQEQIAQLVERGPEIFIARYDEDPRSFGGRYVNSDLMKEMFPVYSASPESRNRYNAVVHNAAAVLASEQYRRVVTRNDDASKDIATFLTGIPGAGKTTYALLGGELGTDTCVLFEGQLANANLAIPKIELALNSGLKPEIVVVHIPAERALENTIHRFNTVGRGASIEAMASIQGNLPDGLEAVHAHFGGVVDLRIWDRRSTIATELRGWQHLSELRSEGSYEHIKQHLAEVLSRWIDSGRISEEAHRQALGRPPLDLGGVAQKGPGRHERPDEKRSQGLVDKESPKGRGSEC
jgi:hypothetical protein